MSQHKLVPRNGCPAPILGPRDHLPTLAARTRTRRGWAPRRGRQQRRTASVSRSREARGAHRLRVPPDAMRCLPGRLRYAGFAFATPEELEDELQNIAVAGRIEPAAEALLLLPIREPRGFKIAHQPGADDAAQLQLGPERLNVEIADCLFHCRLLPRGRDWRGRRRWVLLEECVENFHNNCDYIGTLGTGLSASGRPSIRRVHRIGRDSRQVAIRCSSITSNCSRSRRC